VPAAGQDNGTVALKGAIVDAPCSINQMQLSRSFNRTGKIPVSYKAFIIQMMNS